MEQFNIERIVNGKVDCVKVSDTGIDCFVECLPAGGMRLYAFSDGWTREDGKAAHHDWVPSASTAMEMRAIKRLCDQHDEFGRVFDPECTLPPLAERVYGIIAAP